MKKDPATISKWCTNKARPLLETIKKVADQLLFPSMDSGWKKWRKQ